MLVDPKYIDFASGMGTRLQGLRELHTPEPTKVNPSLRLHKPSTNLKGKFRELQPSILRSPLELIPLHLKKADPRFVDDTSLEVRIRTIDSNVENTCLRNLLYAY